MKKLIWGHPNLLNINISSLILRIGFGILMLPHGISKLQKFDELSQTFMNFMGLGSTLSLLLVLFSEILCSILIMIGLCTRIAVIPLLITMFVIMDKHNWDLIPKYENVVAFLIGYIIILLLGSGKFSVDHFIYKQRIRRY